MYRRQSSAFCKPTRWAIGLLTALLAYQIFLYSAPSQNTDPIFSELYTWHLCEIIVVSSLIGMLILVNLEQYLEEREKKVGAVSITWKVLGFIGVLGQIFLWVQAQFFLFEEDMQLARKDDVAVDRLWIASLVICIPFYVILTFLTIVTLYCALVGLTSSLCPKVSVYLVLCCKAKPSNDEEKLNFL